MTSQPTSQYILQRIEQNRQRQEKILDLRFPKYKYWFEWSHKKILTISPEIFSQIFSLTHLEQLYLTGLNIQQLPDSLGQLHNLTFLDLTSNQLNQLPNSLSQLHNLTFLDLTGNQLTQLPNSLNQLYNSPFAQIEPGFSKFR